jgi:hypothetical protein
MLIFEILILNVLYVFNLLVMDKLERLRTALHNVSTVQNIHH